MGTIDDTAGLFPVTRTNRSLVPPSSATPQETLRLSVIDRVAGLRHLVRSLHVFAGGENNKQAAPPAKSLREALGKALVDYYPFAGRFVEEDGEVRVACTGEGAWFVEAAAACSLEEVRHLDHPMLIPKEELLPEPAPGVNPLDMPLMMQVTEFTCGGFVVGLISVHTIADGLGAGQFINAVADYARGGAAVARPRITPIWARDVIPDPPKMPAPPPRLDLLDLVYFTTDLSPDHIAKVKSSYLESTGQRCSAFDVCVARTWQARVRALRLPDAAAPVHVCFFANTRHLLPATAAAPASGFYGNCFYTVKATRPSGEVAAADIVDVVRAIRATDKPIDACAAVNDRWCTGGSCWSQQMAKAKPRPAAAILLLLISFLAAAAAGGGSDAETTGGGGGLVGVDGTRFVVDDGRPIYFSGFNAYWLMLVASDPARRGKVVAAFRQAADHGLNLARTWAFSDGGDTPLQAAPGVYDEAMFQGLDFVVAEARRHGIYLLLCLTNNFHDFGGKRQYVQWARDAGHRLATDDDFFNSTVVKDYYKNHVKTVLTRVNTLTGVAYKDDPTILGWELMNEPRCDAEPTGAMVQAWVEEMAPYVKSIDGEHLVTAGLEGFYGAGAHESKDLNPWGIYYGTNFVETHRARGVDFATIHLYPDVWLWGSAADAQLAFLRNWTRSHARDADLYLRKPLLVTEYGKFLWEGVAGANRTQRDYFLRLVLDSIYDSAARGGPLVGGAFWQLLDGGMDTLRDGYEIILPEDRLAATIIGNHSRQLAQLSLVTFTGEDVDIEAAALRRRSRRSPHSNRKIRVRSVGGPSDSDSYYTQTQRLLHILLVRFMSLFTSISSLFSSV